MIQSIDTALLLARMKLNQWKSQDELESIQEKRLRTLISYASEHVPYYKRSLKGASVKCLEDLPKLPLIKKQDLSKQNDYFISNRYRKESLHKVMTSGSTGMSLAIYHDTSESHYGPAFELHPLTEAGIGPLDLQAQITYQKGRRHLLQRLGIFRRNYLSIQDDEFKNLFALKRMKPNALLCYPSYLVLLARANLESGIDFKVEKVFSSAEILSKQATKLISSSFSCSVCEMYGSTETSGIAWQCEKGSMHLNSDSIIAEIVDDEGNQVRRGDYGNIVITPLWRRSMPLIRYCLGDWVAFGPKCSCGRGLHTLKPIEGRNDDFIVLPSGKLLSARSINIMDDMPCVSNYQIIQEKEGLFVFRFVPADKQLPDSSKKEIIRRIKSGCHGEEVRIEFEMVDKIERGRTGKIRTIISKVKKKP
jgi:phenylacetate-CoA ligase